MIGPLLSILTENLQKISMLQISCHRFSTCLQQKRVRNISRHTVVCRAALEAGASHREYIYRKKVNAIFTPL